MADADRALAVARLEAAVSDVYRAALERASLPADLADTLLVLAQHHDEHAAALAALAQVSRADVEADEAIAAELNDTVLGDDQLGGVIAAERRLVDAHLELLGALDTTGAAASVASIVPIEAQHVAALRLLRGDAPASVASDT